MENFNSQKKCRKDAYKPKGIKKHHRLSYSDVFLLDNIQYKQIIHVVMRLSNIFETNFSRFRWNNTGNSSIHCLHLAYYTIPVYFHNKKSNRENEGNKK